MALSGVGEPITYQSYHMDADKAVEVHVATDGVTCRHDFQGFFGTAWGITPVKSGSITCSITLYT